MKSNAKKVAKQVARKPTASQPVRAASAAKILRQIGNDWALHWNAGAGRLLQTFCDQRPQTDDCTVFAATFHG